MNRPVILHMISGLSTGGAERMLVKLILETEDRFRHEVLSLTKMDQQGVILKYHGIPVHTMNMSGNIFSLLSLIRINSFVNEINPDLIHGWMYHGNVAATIASGSMSSHKCPYFHSIRHSLHDIKLEKWTTAMIIRLNGLISRRPNKVIYNSYTNKVQHTQFGYCPDNTLVIPNGFNTKLFDKDPEMSHNTRKSMEIPSGSFVFLQVGRNHPMKNHKLFLQSAYHLLEQNSYTVKPTFILIGRGIPDDQNLIRWIEKIGDSGRVLLLDEQSDLLPYYCSSDAFSLTSSWGEAFPNVLGEAMSCGLPCITTDVGDSARIVQGTGIVVKPGNLEEMCMAMKTMIDWDEEERRSRGLMARKLISEKYSIQKISEEYCNLYFEYVN